MSGVHRCWDAGRPVDLLATLAPLRRGSGDPAHQVDGSGSFWWACGTPEGPGTIMLRSSGTGVVRAQAWGAGAPWLLERVPALLGAADDWSALDVSAHAGLREQARHNVGLRLPATGLVLDALVPAVLEQRVTGPEARTAWRGLLRRFGSPAPGPRADLRVPPTPATLLEITGWHWHQLGVDSRRQRAIRAAATVSARLEECVGMARAQALARLQHVPGVGQWTAAETAQRAFGDPDAVSVGDYHIHDVVVHFLTGRARGSDAEMLELLAPWAGQRQRVVRLIERSGVGAPRYGPRLAPVDIRAI